MGKKNLSSLMNGIIGTEEVCTPETKKSKDEARTSLVLNKMLFRKIKFISLSKSRLLKDVLNEALEDYISKYEDVNGTIDLH